MNRTARRIRTISAATLALTAAGLTLGSLSAVALPPPLPLPIPLPFPFPTLPPPVFTIPPITLPPLPTIPPVFDGPVVTIDPGFFSSVSTALNAPTGPVERGANYAYSMKVSLGSLTTGPVTLLHSIPSTINGAVWSCSTTGGATCGGGAAGAGNISRVLTMPASSTVTFLVNGTVALDANNFAVAMSAVRAGTPSNRSVDVSVNVPAAPTTTVAPPAPTTTAAPVVPPVAPVPVVPPAPAPAPTPAPAPAPAPTPAQQPIVIVVQQTAPPVAKKAVAKKVVKKAKKKAKKKIVRKPARRVVSTKKVVR